MATRRIEPEFRAAVVKTSLLPAPHAAVAESLGRLELPRDTRTPTRGIRGTLRWNQTRLGRNVRPDSLHLSERARDAHAGGGQLPPDDLAAAEETLDHLLAELRNRGLAGHPRTRALAALRERLARDLPARRLRGPAPTTAGGTPQPSRPAGEGGGFLEALADLWDTLLGMLQRPDEKAAHRQALMAEASALAVRGDRRGARRRLQQLLTRDPRDAEAHARLGRLHLEAAEYGAAEPHLVAAVAGRPRDPRNHIALGELHYQLGDSQEALVAFGQALRLAPEHADANAWLGILAHEGGRPVEALRFLERAIAFDPNHAVARYYLAQVSLSQGDALRARYQLDIVRRLEPAADLERFRGSEPALPAHTGTPAFSGWVVPRPGKLAGSPTA